MSESVENGVDQGQVDSSTESELVNEGQGASPSSAVDTRYEELQSQIADISGAIQSMQAQFGETLRQLTPTQRQDLKQDLNQMLRENPAEAFRTMFEENNNRLRGDLTSQWQRERFDQEVQAKYPVNDPKFKAALNRNWKVMVNRGLDPNHPQALLQAAEYTALQLGEKPKTVVSNEYTGESSNPQPPRRSKSAIADTDPRIVTYMMTNPSKEKLESFKQKLAASDKRKKG